MDITKKNRADIKKHFIANNIPTEENFHDFIDATVNMTDDNIGKVEGSPISLQSEGDVSGPQKVLDLYTKFTDDAPLYGLSLNPKNESTGTNTPGLAFSDATAQTRLFIEHGSGNIGIGTQQPAAKLSIGNKSGNVWQYAQLQNSLSLELGNNADGDVGSIKLHSYVKDKFVFLRPSNGNFHLDCSTGNYYLNHDPDVVGNNPGFFQLSQNMQDKVVFRTNGNSYFNGGNLGIGTSDPKAKLTVANDSPRAWKYNEIKDNISLELGKNGNGSVGSIKLHSFTENQYVFIRPSNGNYHIDSSTGEYYFNHDTQVVGDKGGRLYLSKNGQKKVQLSTHDNSYVAGGNFGIRNADPKAPLSIGGNGKERDPDEFMHITQDCILFGGLNKGYQADSAQISAGRHATDTLCIVGMGKTAAERKIKIWAEGGLTINGQIKNSAFWGTVQQTDWINNWDAVMNYEVPSGCVMVGLYSEHSNSKEDRRWKVKYRRLNM